MSTRLLTIIVYSFLLIFSAADNHAQNPTETTGSTQLPAEQQAVLKEALQLSHNVIQLHGSGKFDEALPLARRAVELRRSVLGDNNALVADALTNVAGLHLAKQEFERAESIFKQALASYDKASFLSQHTAYVLESLTVLRWRVRDYDRAEIYGKRAIEAKEKLYGVQSLQLLDSLQNLLRVYESTENDKQANELYLRILSLAENTKDKLPNHLTQLLVAFHCSYDDEKQRADTLAINRRIEKLLGWQPGAEQEPVMRGVLNGKALSLPKPPYPERARASRASGPVVVQVEIDGCGRVTGAKVISGDLELRDVSLQAARSARFSPTLLSGMPVKVIGVIRYNFVYQAPIR